MSRKRWTQWGRSPYLRFRGVLSGAPPAAPAAVTDLVATPNLDGTIVLTWTLPAGATSAMVRYNVDQSAAPAETYSGILLGTTAALTLTLTGCEYGAAYRFSIWAIGAGGYSSTADTASATGPFNPNLYSQYLVSWIDARRETAYSHGNTVQTPTQWVTGGPAFTQATANKRPTWRQASDGIGGVPAFLFDNSAGGGTEQDLWVSTDVELHSETRGLTTAALCNVDELGVAMYLFSKWEDTGREWRLGKGTGDFVCYYDRDGDGSPQGFVSGGGNNTNTHALASTWNPGVDARLYDLGALIDTDTAINYTTLGGSGGATSVIRIGGDRHSSSANWSGRASVILAYSEALSETAAILLSDHLAALAGA